VVLELEPLPGEPEYADPEPLPVAVAEARPIPASGPSPQPVPSGKPRRRRRSSRRGRVSRGKSNTVLYIFAGIGVLTCGCCVFFMILGVFANPMDRPVVFRDPAVAEKKYEALGAEDFADRYVGKVVEWECEVVERDSHRRVIVLALSSSGDGYPVVCTFGRASLASTLREGGTYKIRGILTGYSPMASSLRCFAVDGAIR
jgi:hypothetical protein